MFDPLLESSRGDNSNNGSNIGFREEIGIIKIKFKTLSGALNFFDNHSRPVVTLQILNHAQVHLLCLGGCVGCCAFLGAMAVL